MSEPRNDAPDSLSPFQRAQMENYRQEARDAERAEQYPLAVELLERALKLDPRDYRCRVQLASLANQLGNLSRALAIYKELLPDVKNDSMLFNNLGAVYFDLGALTRAVEYFQESIRCNPSNDLPHANLTYLYSLLGETDAAWTHSQALRQLIPHNRYGPFAKVAQFRAMILKGHQEEALSLLANSAVEDKQNLLFNLQRLIFARELGIEDEIPDIVTRNLHRAKESLHKGYAPHKTYYRMAVYQLAGGLRGPAMQSAKSAIIEGPYKGIVRFAGLFYLEQLGIPPSDKLYQLWHNHEQSLPIPE